MERIGNALAFGLVLTIAAVAIYAIYGILTGNLDIFSFGGSEEVRPTPIVVVRQPTLTPFEGIIFEPSPTPTWALQQPTPMAPTETTEPQITLTATATPEPTT
ncbi:MAG: hypothetical protein H0T73_19635, partial [Ardenticatenales bacterium]|nr:hypothetical protein [Ardenticatenales bacterium]